MATATTYAPPRTNISSPVHKSPLTGPNRSKSPFGDRSGSLQVQNQAKMMMRTPVTTAKKPKRIADKSPMTTSTLTNSQINSARRFNATVSKFNPRKTGEAPLMTSASKTWK